MSRPLLGVSACTRKAGAEQSQAVTNRYLTGPLRYGEVAAVIVPALPNLIDARDIAAKLDGLMLTGSPSNVEPERYGQGGAPDAAGPFDPARDEMSTALIEAMLERGKPVFGICRGLQEINVAFGGTLRRDVGCSGGSIDHHAPDDAAFDAMFDHVHNVTLTTGGLLSRALGRTELTVNSVHYQGIGALAPGLAVEAQAADGMIEAVSATVNGAPVMAVQWHPEWRPETNPDSRAFFHLLGRALRGEALTMPTRTAA